MGQHHPPIADDYFKIGRAYYYNNNLPEADSAFTEFIELEPESTAGYSWKGRIKLQQDSESLEGAKPYYEKVIEVGSKNPEKYKKDLLHALRFHGYYHYLKMEYVIAKSYYDRLLELSLKDQVAKDALEVLRKL